MSEFNFPKPQNGNLPPKGTAGAASLWWTALSEHLAQPGQWVDLTDDPHFSNYKGVGSAIPGSQSSAKHHGLAVVSRNKRLIIYRPPMPEAPR